MCWGKGGRGRKKNYQVHLPGTFTGKDGPNRESHYQTHVCSKVIRVTRPPFTHNRPPKLLKLKTGRTRATNSVGEKEVGPGEPPVHSTSHYMSDRIVVQVPGE